MTMKTGFRFKERSIAATSRNKAFFNVFREADKDFVTKVSI